MAEPEPINIQISLEHAAAQVALAGGHHGHASDLAGQLVAADPEDADAHHLLGLACLLRGDAHEAVEAISRAVELRKDVPQYHSNLGEALRRAGRAEEGATHCRVALAMRPAYFEASVNLGACLFASGDHDGALEQFEKAAQLKPDDPAVMAAKADALRELGFVRGSLRLYRRAIELDPTNAHAHANIGPLLLAIGRTDEALEHCKRAVELSPDDGIGYLNLGRCYVELDDLETAMDAYADAYDRSSDSDVLCRGIGYVWQEVGDLQQAELWYTRALGIDPDNVETRCLLAGLWTEADRFEEAIAVYREILAADPDSFEAQLGLGRALWDDGDADGAVASLRKAAELRPEVANVQALVGSVLASAGEVAEAVACDERALEINPNCIPALSGLATTLRSKLDINRVRDMQRLLSGKRLRDGPKAALHSGLSYYFDGVGRYNIAAQHVEKGNELYWSVRSKRGWSYDPAAFEAEVDAIIATFTPEFFARTREHGLRTDVPVFVVGMPRSGTTLTEQILASHPQVFGAGERTFAPRAFARLPRIMGVDAAPINCIADAGPEHVRATAQGHLHQLGALVVDAGLQPAEIARVVDKMPDNYLLLGWIATAFPNAKIIWARRDPRDIAVSCWQTQFAKIRWAFHHEHIAHRLQQYLRVMAHWQRVLPVPIFVCDYEQLVADQEGLSRRLIDFIGVKWDDACLRFHETDRVVRTASVTQVREPIYTRSVERWRRYEDTLAGIFDAIT